MQEYAPDPYGDGTPEQRYDGDSGVGASAAAPDRIEPPQPGKTFGRPAQGLPPPIGYSQEDSESNPVYLRMAQAWGAGNVEFDPDTGTWVTVSKTKSKKKGAAATAAAYPGGMMPGMPGMPYGMYGAPMMPPYAGMGMYPGAMPPMYPGMMPPPVVEGSSKSSKEDMKREAKKEMKKLLRKEHEEEERRAEKEARRRRKKEEKHEEKARKEEECRRKEEDEQRAAREAALIDQERVIAQQAALKRQEHEAKIRAKQLAFEREAEESRLAEEREAQERKDREEHERARQRALRGVEEAARLGAHSPTTVRNSWLSESSRSSPYWEHENEHQEYLHPENHYQRPHQRADTYSTGRSPQPSRPASPQSYKSDLPAYRSHPPSRDTSGDSYRDRERNPSKDWLDDSYSDARSIRSTTSSQRRVPMERDRQQPEAPQPLFQYQRSRSNSSASINNSQRPDLSDTRSVRSVQSSRSRAPSVASSTRSGGGNYLEAPSGSQRPRMPAYTRAEQTYTYGSSAGDRSVEPAMSSSASYRSGRSSASRGNSSDSQFDGSESYTSRSQYKEYGTHNAQQTQGLSEHEYKAGQSHTESSSRQYRRDLRDDGEWDFNAGNSTGRSASSTLPYDMGKLKISSKKVPSRPVQAPHAPSVTATDDGDDDGDNDDEAIYVRSDGRSRSMTSSIPSSFRGKDDRFDDTRSIRSGRSAHSYLSARPNTSRRMT